MALSAAPPSPRMPPGAPVPRSRLLPAPRTSQLHPHPAHTGVGPLASPSWRGVPTRRSCPRAPPAASRPLPGGGGAGLGQMLGVFCADPGAWGACLLLEGQRQDKAGWTRGTLCLRSGGVPDPAWGGGGCGERGMVLGGRVEKSAKTVTGTRGGGRRREGKEDAGECSAGVSVWAGDGAPRIPV